MLASFELVAGLEKVGTGGFDCDRCFLGPSKGVGCDVDALGVGGSVGDCLRLGSGIRSSTA